MLTEVLAALASAAGTAIVAAMATDTWISTRERVLKIFRQSGSKKQSDIERQLDADASLVAEAASQETVRQGLAPAWQEEIARLLEQHPLAEEQIRTLISGETHIVQAQRFEQTNIGRDNATVFGIQSGNVIYHQGSHPAEEAG